LIGEGRQSALLLRVGPLIISEFTNIGKVRAWPADRNDAPRFGERDYSRYDLTGSCMVFPMNRIAGKAAARWFWAVAHQQPARLLAGQVAALIERHTGIRITALDWYPR